jgi:IS1 family transposase
VERKAKTKTRENINLLTMVSRFPRQIAGFDAAFNKSAERIQAMVDRAPPAKKYCTDGYFGFCNVVYWGEHVRNVRDKSDTYTVEGVNADLRCYIPVLARRSRCFARKLETLYAVVAVFVEAYNKFGEAKARWHASHERGELPFGVVDFL